MLTFLSILIIGAAIGGSLWVQKQRRIANAARAARLKRFRVILPKRDGDKDRERATERDFKEKVALMEQLYSGLHGLYTPGLKAWISGQEYLGFELTGVDAPGEGNGTSIGFYVLMQEDHVELVRKQVTAFYEDATIIEDESLVTEGAACSAGAALRQRADRNFPIRTYTQLGSDPLNDLTSILSHLSEGSRASVQILVRPLSNAWMNSARLESAAILQNKAYIRNHVLRFIHEAFIMAKPTNAPLAPVTEFQQQRSKAIADKAKKLGFEAVIRVIVAGEKQANVDLELQNALTAFGQYDDPSLNGLAPLRDNAHVRGYATRSIEGAKRSVLNTEELATLFHFPSSRYNTNPQIAWQATRIVPAPGGLAETGLYMGLNTYRGESRKIYLNDVDRFRHLYIIGQTGMGKSQFIKVLAKQDIAAGRGFCALDPHGELADDLLPWIPKERANDVILLDPADESRPFGLNLFEAETPEERDFIANDALKIMIGLFGEEVFSARLQDYFRNAALTFMEDTDEPGTIVDIVKLFTDEEWQKKKVAKVKNPIVREWWEHTYASMGDREKQEMIPFWAAKFGQFITNSLIRNIVGQSKSTFNIAKAMDEKKIILVKLSKGLIGDLNTQLLGMIIVNKIQVAAMRRAKQPKDQRVPFYLYVDEFQNFVTDAFESILSEARKYKLGLIVAHQYIAQLAKGNNDKVKNAVFGNVGSMVSLKIGATDAEYLAKEFAPGFTEQDLTNMEGFTAACKLSTNNVISTPFSLVIDKDFAKGNELSAEAIATLSKTIYGRPREAVDREIMDRIGSKTMQFVKAATS